MLLALDRQQNVIDPAPGGLEFYPNATGAGEYATLSPLPTNFGSGEFTWEMDIRFDVATYGPVGTAGNDTQRRNNWSDDARLGNSYSDPHNYRCFFFDMYANDGSQIELGSMALCGFASGRLGWHISDQAPNQPQNVRCIESATGPVVADGNYHRIICRRRFPDASNSEYTLWIDGVLINSQTSDAQVNMWTTYWQNWVGRPVNQQFMMFGGELVNVLAGQPWGLADCVVRVMSFYNRAKSDAEIAATVLGSVDTTSSDHLASIDFRSNNLTMTNGTVVALSSNPTPNQI